MKWHKTAAIIHNYIQHPLTWEWTSFLNLGTLSLPLCFIYTWLSPDSKPNPNTYSEDRPEATLLLTALRRTGSCYYPPYLGLYTPLWQSYNITVENLKEG